MSGTVGYNLIKSFKIGFRKMYSTISSNRVIYSLSCHPAIFINRCRITIRLYLFFIYLCLSATRYLFSSCGSCSLFFDCLFITFLLVEHYLKEDDSKNSHKNQGYEYRKNSQNQDLTSSFHFVYFLLTHPVIIVTHFISSLS